LSIKPGTLQPVDPTPALGFAPVPVASSPIPAAVIPVPAAIPASAKPETPKAEAKTVEIAKVAETPKIEIAKVETPVAPVAVETPQPRPAPAVTASRVAPAPTPSPAATRTAAAVPPSVKSVVRSGWMIQVGAFTAEQEAKQRLSSIQSKASKVVDGTDPFTESVEKGGSTFYRARFAGFDKDKAEAACKVLKRDGVECVTIKN
jgi:D-alanyl-D-alanine carboxypeptidase